MQKGRDSIIASGQWETTIGGVRFVSRRKSTAVMVRARGFLAVAGQLAGEEPGEPTGSAAMTARLKSVADFTEAVMRAAVLEPVIAPAGEPTVEGVQYAFEDMQAYGDAWLTNFMQSGLTADPIVPSCEA